MRDTWIQVRVNKEEKESIKNNSKHYGLSMSSYFKFLHSKQNIIISEDKEK